MREVEKAGTKWKAIVQASVDPLPVVRIPFVVPIYKKVPSCVTQAFAQIFLRLKVLGLPVHRAHTDRGSEWINKVFASYCDSRDIVHTTTAAELPQSNGLAEKYVGLIKRPTRVLLHASGVSKDLWPHAMRHSVHALQQQAFIALGVPTRPVLPFGSAVWVRERVWRSQTWTPRAVQGIVLAPAEQISKGWIILVTRSDGTRSLLTSTLCYQEVRDPAAHVPEAPEEPPDDPPNATPLPSSASHRATGRPAVLPDADSASPPEPDSILPSDIRYAPMSSTWHPDPKVRLRAKSALRGVKSPGGGSVHSPSCVHSKFGASAQLPPEADANPFAFRDLEVSECQVEGGVGDRGRA